MPSSPPGSGYPDPTREEPQRPDETGVRAIEDGSRPEHSKARQSGVPGSCALCGKPWPCPPEAAHRRRMRASSAHLSDQPIIEGSWLPPEFLLGVAAWDEPKRSWWERFKHWADEHPVKLWLAFWAVLLPVAAVIVVMFL